MNNAKKVAKRIVREPVEVLKQAEKQVFGGETPEISKEKAGQVATPTVSPQEKVEIEAQGARQLQALEKEMADIRALRGQKVEEPKKEEAPKPLVEPATKRSRKLSGWGAKLKQLKTQTETRLPPSS